MKQLLESIRNHESIYHDSILLSQLIQSLASLHVNLDTDTTDDTEEM